MVYMRVIVRFLVQKVFNACCSVGVLYVFLPHGWDTCTGQSYAKFGFAGYNAF